MESHLNRLQDKTRPIFSSCLLKVGNAFSASSFNGFARSLLCAFREFPRVFPHVFPRAFPFEIPVHLPCSPLNFHCVPPATSCAPQGFPIWFSPSTVAVHSLTLVFPCTFIFDPPMRFPFGNAQTAACSQGV